jgi:hypothetical protein
MKKYKILYGVLAAAALCGVDATAQINYQNGDLLAGFRNGGSTEIIMDLGSISLFQQAGAAPFSFNGVSSALTGQFGSLSSVTWSVFGVNDTSQSIFNHSVTQTDANTMWTTKARINPAIQTSAPFVGGNSSQQLLAVGDVQTIGGLTSTSTPGVAQISLNIVSVATSLGGYSSLMGNPYNGNLQGDWGYNIENTGPGASDLYQSDPGNPFTQKGSYRGDFVLGPSGTLTFNPVPEPSTWALLGTGLLTLLGARRFGRGK